MKEALRQALFSVVLVTGSCFAVAMEMAMASAAPRTGRAELEAAIHRWMMAVNAQDVDTLTATMTADVQLLDEAATVTGRDAAIHALKGVATRGRLSLTSLEITVLDNAAWHVVAFVQTRKGGDVHSRGQALEIWKRVKGRWQLHRQMAGLITPGASLTRPSTSEPVLDRPNN